MTPNVTLRALLLSVASFSLPAAALAEDILLDPIIAWANLEPTEAGRVGATAVVVDEVDLRQGAEIRLTDYFSRIAGFSVRGRGPLGTQTGFALRGASQNYVPVVIDGIVVTDPSMPQNAFDFGGMTTTDISRIEIVKGSQSALYGSGAVGGVISITTREPEEDGLHHRIEAEAGSYDTTRLSYGLTSKGERHSFAATLAHVETDGFSAADENDGNAETDGFRATRLSFRGSYDLDNGVRIGASGFAESSFGHFDEAFPLPTDGTPGNETNDNDSVGLRLFTQFTTGAVEHELSAALFDVDRISTYDGFPSAYRGERSTFGYRGAMDAGERARLVFGLERVREQSSDEFGFSGSNTMTSGFAEVVYAANDQFDLTASLRHDDHSRFGGHDSARLAAAWRPTDDLTLRGSFGNGFRAPSNYELFSYYGDPTLRPEKSRSADLGVEKAFASGARVQATAFWLETDNLIFFSDRGTPDWGDDGYAQAPGTSRRSGVELEAAMPVGPAELTAAYTYTDSSTNAASSWSEVPRHVIALSLGGPVAGRVSGFVSLEHAADRPTLPDYTVVNTTFTYDFGTGAEAYLRIENLFDEEYQLVDGYGTSDRAVYLGLRKSF